MLGLTILSATSTFDERWIGYPVIVHVMRPQGILM